MELFSHQRQGLSLGQASNRAFFWECGTGKTLLALKLVQYWQSQGLGPALVVCPLSIIDSAWLADGRQFTPGLSITSLWAKTPAERRRRLQQDHDIYVVNFEGLKMLYGDIVAKDFGVLIVDESSKMKSPRSQITKALLSLAGVPFRGSAFRTNRPIPHRYALSGTPAPNDESEYWAQIKFITGPGDGCFHDNYYIFRSQYFHGVPIGCTGQKIWKFRYAMREQFQTAMTPAAHVVRKADCLDLPEQIHQVRTVHLSRAERQAYDAFEEDLVLRFGDQMVLGTTALVETMKLRQLTSGFAYSEAGEVIQVGTAKLAELRSLLEEIGPHQVIIWANFRAEIKQLLEALPGAVALWSGTDDREQVIEAFKSGQAQYLIANPQSAGHGLTFTNCRYAVYYSLSYSYELQKQSEDRIHRIGQQVPCEYFYLLADRTVDEMIHRIVRKKGDLSSATLAYLRRKHDDKIPYEVAV
jgi:SNF2 family DNA or RNA helicase